MDIRGFLKPTSDAVQPRHLLANATAGAVTTAIYVALAYLNDAGPLVIGLVIANIAAISFLILDKMENKRSAHALVLALIIVGIALVGWSSWNKRQVADQFQLTLNGMTIKRDGGPLPTGEARVTGISPTLYVGNTNAFPLFIKIERRYGKTGISSSRLRTQGEPVTKLEPGQAVELFTDKLSGIFENGQYHEVEVEFEILYGRSADRLNKRFNYTADWRFFLCPGNGNLCGSVGAKNETLKNEWVDGV